GPTDDLHVSYRARKSDLKIVNREGSVVLLWVQRRLVTPICRRTIGALLTSTHEHARSTVRTVAVPKGVPNEVGCKDGQREDHSRGHKKPGSSKDLLRRF